jgi:hypothetical protein
VTGVLLCSELGSFLLKKLAEEKAKFSFLIAQFFGH